MGPPGSITGLPGGPQQGDPRDLRNRTLYDPENAKFALQNAMLAQGRNPFTRNLMNQYLESMAPGLGMAFNLQQAQNPGLNPSTIGTSTPGAFSDFLQQVLSGGSAGAALQGASQFLTGGGAANLINQQNAGLAGGGSLMNANPFVSMLENMLSSGGGKGVMDALQALNSPFMGRSMAGAYAGNLQNTLGNNIRFMANNPDDQGFMSFLLGGQAQPMAPAPMAPSPMAGPPAPAGMPGVPPIPPGLQVTPGMNPAGLQNPGTTMGRPDMQFFNSQRPRGFL